MEREKWEQEDEKEEEETALNLRFNTIRRIGFHEIVIWSETESCAGIGKT